MVVQYQFATPIYAQAVQLRQEVLRIPLGLDIADDPLHEEHDQIHFGAFENGILVGTASLVRGNDSFKMRQVAIAPSQQGKGLGADLVSACEAFAKTSGVGHLYCHARDVAKAFYEKCGWKVEGDAFEEVGIKHFKMVVRL